MAIIKKVESKEKRRIDLTGPDGNAYWMLSHAKSLTRQLSEVDPQKYNWERISAIMTSGDYENLIETFDEYFGDYVDLER